MISTTIICALACLVLVDAERRQRETQRTVAKIVASCAFVATAILAVCQRGDADRAFELFQGCVVIGLVLGVVGDIALLYKRGFLVGLVAFLLGHLAYAVAVGYLVPPGLWLDHAGWLAAGPLVIGLGILAALWRTLDTLAVPVIAYVAVIVTMVIAATAATRAQLAPTTFAVGAALFFASDIAVARDKFVASTFANKLWGLPAYYAAQLLIAWSLVP